MPRLVVLGCGTGVGKTRLSVALLRELAQRGLPSLGLKPVESGIQSPAGSQPPAGSDAVALADAGSLRQPSNSSLSHPLHALRDPVSPHLAARAAGLELDVKRIASWVQSHERAVTPLVASHSVIWTIVETAGGVFSPLSPSATNFDLALAIEPAIWVLVAADALGVLHDVSATTQAMRARGRTPEHLVLSGAREPDASTGSNAAELVGLGIAKVSAVLARNDDRGVAELVNLLLAEPPQRPAV